MQTCRLNGFGLARRTTLSRRHRSAVAPQAARDDDDDVRYGAGWYEATKKQARRKATLGSSQRSFATLSDVCMTAEYRAANDAANNGMEVSRAFLLDFACGSVLSQRKDLYSDNWDGDKYKGSGFNILSLLIVLCALLCCPPAFLRLTFRVACVCQLWACLLAAWSLHTRRMELCGVESIYTTAR